MGQIISFIFSLRKSGQIISCVWRYVRSKFRNEPKTLVDSSHEQPSHYITIPDGEVEPVSSSIPEYVTDLTPDVEENDQPSHYITIPNTETEHVLSSTPENVTDFITPDVPCFVVDLGPDADQKENCVTDLTPDVEETAEKLIRVVEEKIVHEKEAINKVYDQVIKETCIRRIGVYTSKQKILLVGEGDFSFSSSLAVAFASASNIVATSLDSQEFLIKNYKKFMMNKANVESRGGVLMHGVNVKSMNKDPVLGSVKFDRIIYNFPHTGDFGRTQIDLRNNKELVRGFIRNAKKMINDDGEIHIRHKTNGFFLHWDIPKIGSDQGLTLIRNPKFHRSEYPGYHTKYGFGGNKDFDSTPSRTYIFGLFP